jgi:integrase
MRPRDIRGRTITYTAEKTGKRGKAVVSLDLANRLKAVAGETYIFPKRGKPDEHRTRQTVWKDVRKAAAALRAAGVVKDENISPHSARKTFAVEDAEHYGLKHTQRALQHRDKRTTQMYAFSDRYIGEYSNSYTLQRILDKVDVLQDSVQFLAEKLEAMENIGNIVYKSETKANAPLTKGAP